jgi:hypothetical protein
MPIPEVRKLLADKGLLPVAREIQVQPQRIARRA